MFFFSYSQFIGPVWSFSVCLPLGRVHSGVQCLRWHSPMRGWQWWGTGGIFSLQKQIFNIFNYQIFPQCSGANANTNNLTPSSKSSSDTQPNKASPQMTQYQSQAFMQQSAQQQLQNMQQIQPSSHQSQSAGVMPSVPVVNNREDPTVWETRKIVSGTPINVNNGE